MKAHHGVRVVAAATAVLTLIGCTASEAPSETSAGNETPSESATPSTTPTSEPELEPQVIVVHPSRGPVEIGAAAARRVLAGDVDNWADLGLAGQPVNLVEDGLARTRIRRVARDANAITVVPASRVSPMVAPVSVAGVNPIERPDLYPLLGPGPKPPRPVTVTIVGDLMLARGVAESMGDDLFAPLRPTASYLRRADVTIGNLESSLSQDGIPTQGTDSFGADPRVLSSLERAGFDVLSLANNHVGDYGLRALQQTIKRIKASPIAGVGAGSNLREARRPAIVSVRGTDIGVLAFNSIGESPAATASSPGTVEVRMPPRTGPQNRSELDAMADAVGRLRRKVDVVLVIPHWGDQYTSVPIGVQRRVAHRLARAGATAVLGGHPHWVQGMEMSGESLIAYSLGNFIFDMDFSEPTMRGFALDLTFWDGRLMSAEPVPIVIDPQFAAHLATGGVRRRILDDIWTNSFGSLSR
ncbi:MAG TPA: CapA family protein [Actinomycetes bacterium]|nr:CapA family protein [Actinomycetes bacterium]